MRITAPSLTFAAAFGPYESHLRGGSGGKSPKTVVAYLGALRKLLAVIGDKPLDSITTFDIEQFIIRIDQDPRYAKNSLNNYVRSLRPFFRWALAKGEIDHNPMDQIRTPGAADVLVPVPLDRELELLIECIGPRRRDFAARRDHAIVRLFMSTGVRRAELANMRVGDYDRDLGQVLVTGKGDRQRIVGISGDRAVDAMDAYLRVRVMHPARDLPWLWLGEKGRLTPMGVYQMLQRRARQAGISIHPHQFRHWYAHQFLSAGGQETALQTSAGWRTRQMVGRYAASAGSARAAAESRRLAVGDLI
jgi:site-specific recombinase XerD